MRSSPALAVTAMLSLTVHSTLIAQIAPADPPKRTAIAYEVDNGSVVAVDTSGVYLFDTWAEYFQSSFFYKNDMRCGHLRPDQSNTQFATAADCTSTFNNPAAEYAPSAGPTYRIPVVVHILQSTSGSGAISDAMVHSQIDILNQDFNALAGSLGANGNDASIEFYLPTTDPNGNPSTGITRSTNTTWYNDGGTYYNSLSWDTTRYLNIYTNTASGNLGYAYVPNGGGVVGSSFDRVVIYWASFGLNAPIGSPYNLGRTVTHEVGHYLGLYHTFDGGCTNPATCNSNGDLICDTNPESGPNFSPCTRTTCGSLDPTNNYMDYSDDICMTEFTVEQVRRMRCTLENFRVDLPDAAPNTNPPAKVANPSPANGASNVSTSTGLSWGAAAGATSYNVFFGTSANPPSQGSQGGTSFAPGALANNTTYFWRIDSVNLNGTTTGDLWSFTTAPAGGAITLSVTGFKQKAKWNATLTWSGATGSTVEVWRGVNGGALSLITTTANDGNYTNSTSFKGSGSLTYQIRTATQQSNTATATF